MNPMSEEENRLRFGKTLEIDEVSKPNHFARVAANVMGTVCVGWLIGPTHQNLRTMGVIAADSAEEDLAVHA
jgi:hypothetical protein